MWRGGQSSSTSGNIEPLAPLSEPPAESAKTSTSTKIDFGELF
jgi:hypothetical protein